jgi:hypothetical protein
VHLGVANSKDAFDSAWDQHKASNPHKYDCSRRKNHTTKYDLGTSKKSLGTDKKSLGIFFLKDTQPKTRCIFIDPTR